MSVPMPKTGDVFAGKYVIRQLLGQGGMGAVYAAEHQVLRQKVAIKFLLGEALSQPEAVARFLNEARSAHTIQSEHVARVTDADEIGGLPYMIMEYLDGVDLARLIEDRGRTPLPVPTAIDYVLQALDGVHHAHGMQIVHRDLKPSNLFLAKRADGTNIIKVLDFGISKQQTPGLGPGGGSFTSTRSMLGSPLYMSPEQLRNSKSVDHRADIWAMGVIITEFLTGLPPFAGDNLGELFAAILEDEAPSLRTRNPAVPPELDAVVMRCLAKKRDARFNSAVELGRALMPFATDVGRSLGFLNRAPESVLHQASPLAMTSNETPAPNTAPLGGPAAAVSPTGVSPAFVRSPAASTTPMRTHEGLGHGLGALASISANQGLGPGVMNTPQRFNSAPPPRMASTGSAVSIPVQTPHWQTPSPNFGATPQRPPEPRSSITGAVLLLGAFVVAGLVAGVFYLRSTGKDKETGPTNAGTGYVAEPTTPTQAGADPRPSNTVVVTAPSTLPTLTLSPTSSATALVAPPPATHNHTVYANPPVTASARPPAVSPTSTSTPTTRPTNDAYTGRN